MSVSRRCEANVRELQENGSREELAKNVGKEKLDLWLGSEKRAETHAVSCARVRLRYNIRDGSRWSRPSRW